MTSITTNRPTCLDEVLAYRHSGVLRRYGREHHASPQEADEVFQQMLKLLYLGYRSAIDETQGSGFTITTEIEKLDWIWHTFLMFTRDYADFCERHFGFFVHHVPGEDDEDDDNEAPADQNDLRSRMERQFALVYDVLGEETLTAWYDHCRYAAPA
jgi:hypothetical protein